MLPVAKRIGLPFYLYVSYIYIFLIGRVHGDKMDVCVCVCNAQGPAASDRWARIKFWIQKGKKKTCIPHKGLISTVFSSPSSSQFNNTIKVRNSGNTFAITKRDVRHRSIYIHLLSICTVYSIFCGNKKCNKGIFICLYQTEMMADKRREAKEVASMALTGL